MPPSPGVPRSRSIAAALAVAAVAGSALARGGVDLAALAIAAPLAAAALFLAPRGGRGEELSLPVLALGLAGAGGVVAFQLVPLPPALLRAVSPAAAAVMDDALSPVGLFPSWRPLSLDPAATALELAKAAMFTAVAAAAAILGGSDRRRDQLLRGLALSGVAVAAVWLGAALAGLSPLVAPRVTFVNTNHLAGFLQLAAWPALGFALRARGPARAAWLGVFAVTASGVFLSLSRAGIAAFFAAAGLFAVLRLRTGSTRDEPPFDSAAASRPLRSGRTGAVGAPRRALRSGAAVAAGGVALALAISAWLALDPIVAELRTVGDEATVATKLGAWPPTLALVRDFPAAGIGRGAFATVFPAYKSDPVPRTFTNPENEWLQLPAELGVVAGAGVILLFAWAWLAAARARDLSRPMAGALAGAGALVLQNAFDFGLELAGVAIPFALVLGLASRAMPRVRVGARAVRGSAVAALAVAAGGLLAAHAADRDADPALVASAATGDEAALRARAALSWRPADWLAPAAVGVKLAAEDRCREALPWLTRAMLRNPTAPEAHRATAYCLARSGRAALAKREYRLAFLYGDEGALADAFARFAAPGELLEIAPDTPAGLMAAGRLLRDRPREAAEAWRRAWESFGDPLALAQLASVQLALGAPDEALRLAHVLQARAPRVPSGYVAAARAQDALARPDDALRELELGAARLPGDGAVLEPLGWKLWQRRRFSQAKAVFDGIVAREGPAQAHKRVLIAHALEGQGRYQEALRESQVAREIAPGDVSALELFARLAGNVGRYDDAIAALELASHAATAQRGAYDDELEVLRRARDDQRLQRAARGFDPPWPPSGRAPGSRFDSAASPQ